MSAATVDRTIRRPRTVDTSLTARQVAAAYGCPIEAFDGTGSTIGIVELGGGYIAGDMAKAGLNAGQVTVVNVGAGRSKSDGPNGADGEVMLDVEIVAAVAPGAKIRVYFAENTDAGFLAGLKQATAECDLVSVSWGGPESSWDPAMLKAKGSYVEVLAAARARGVTTFCASGDNGSRDGTSRDVADYPASDPSVVACGGTQLRLTSAGERASEVAWDDDDTSSATGGGVSGIFASRLVPDVSGNASPVTGYQVVIDGGSYVIGGTSAVAPLYAAMSAVLRQAAGGKRWDFVNTVRTNPEMCWDVTVGDNGGYKAGLGYDKVTGWGVVDWSRLLDILTSGTQVPAPGGVPTAPTAPVTPTPTPVTSPVDDFPWDDVDPWVTSPHVWSRATKAARAIKAWKASLGG